MPFLNLDTFGRSSGKMPSVFKELCRPINSNSAQYHESATYHHLGARVSTARTEERKKPKRTRMFLSIAGHYGNTVKHNFMYWYMACVLR